MSQENDVLFHLRNIGPLTPLEALQKYGIMRVASRINDLRRDGYNITTVMTEQSGKRFAKYILEK